MNETTRAAEGAVFIDQIENKDDTPTMEDLDIHVVRNYAAGWKDIGIELGLSFDMMEIIEKDHPHQIVACFREVLSKWLKTAPAPTWSTLEVALSNVKRQHVPVYATTAGGTIVINQIKNKDDKPTMRDLNRYVVANYAADWKDIGLELGLSFDMLEFIEKDHPHLTEAFQQTLHKWLKFTPNATWKILEIALTNVNRQHSGLDPVDDVLAAATKADGTVVIDQIKNKDDTPTMRDLNRYVVDNFAVDWKDIAIELGLSFDMIPAIERDNRYQTVACFQKTLHEWLIRDSTATWSTLEIALTNVRRRQLGLDPVDDVHDVIATQLKKRYCEVLSQGSREAGSLFVAQPSPIAALVKTTTKTSSHSKQNSFSMNCKKFSNIEQFFSEFGKNLTGVTLIEGDPGMGKTTLIRTLSIKWAIGKTLTFSRYLFILFLRDPAVQKIKTLQELSKYLVKEASKAEQLSRYLDSVDGENIIILLDGLDETNSELFKSSYFQKLILGQHLPKATIVVTSRPSATVLLGDNVHWKIDVLGFDQSSREQYAAEALKTFPHLFTKLQSHFQEHAHIAALCSSPSVMHIITSLCLHQTNDCLPLSSTEMYKNFILLTIKRSLNIQGDKVIKCVDDLPSPVSNAYQQLGKFAYDSLVKYKLVFHAEELPELCRYDPTYYGLLQTVEHYSSAAPTRSYSFLHFSLQEYLAASHVASFPSREVDKLFMKSFLIKSSNSDIHLYYMWTLFCGITGGDCPFLKNYLTTHPPDPIKLLYLYHCFFEAQDDKMCHSVSILFENTINFKDHQLEHRHWITSLGLILSKSLHKWKELNLNNCHIGDYGFHLLCQYLCGSDKEQEMATIDLMENDLTEATIPLFCTFINYFHPHTLKLGCNHLATSIQGISDAIRLTAIVKVLNLWGIGLTGIGGAAVSEMLVVLVELNVSNNYLADEGAVMMAEGIAITRTLQKLYLNDNDIGPLGTKAIAQALSVNTSLELLNMSKNSAGKDGAVGIAEAIISNKTLTKFYFWDDRTLDEESAMLIVRNLHLNNVIIKVGLPQRLASDNRLVSYLDNINSARQKNKIQELVVAFY